MTNLVSLTEILKFSNYKLRNKWCKQLIYKMYILHSEFENAQYNICLYNLKVDKDKNLVVVNVSDKLVVGKKLVTDRKFDAPELFKGGRRSKESDIWAAGICIYYINNLKFPWKFASKSDKNFSSWEINSIFPSSVDNLWSKILLQMLCIDPKKRLSAKLLIYKTLDDKLNLSVLGELLHI